MTARSRSNGSTSPPPMVESRIHGESTVLSHNSPDCVEYFEKRRGFVERTYPVGKSRAFGAGKDKVATQDAKENQPENRITSAEADLRKA